MPQKCDNAIKRTNLKINLNISEGVHVAENPVYESCVEIKILLKHSDCDCYYLQLSEILYGSFGLVSVMLVTLVRGSYWMRDASSSVASNEPYFPLALNLQLYIKRSILMFPRFYLHTEIELERIDALDRSYEPCVQKSY
uniref:Uncharacterized protein n=1 Tax=Glossina pallidipes TaxID=7398 RepID=A0A1A9ZHT0_GLOPL